MLAHALLRRDDGYRCLTIEAERSRPGFACSYAGRSPASTWNAPGRQPGGYGFEMDNVENGAARGTRTPDPVITNDVLYRLSYCGGILGL